MSRKVLTSRTGVVLWSRARLCRNLANHQFISSDKGRKCKSGSCDASSGQKIRRATYEKIEKAVNAVASKKSLKLKAVTDIPDWKIVELYERGLFSDYLKKKRDDKYRGVVTGPEGRVVAMVNERHHLVLQDVRPGFQLEKAWSEVDILDDLFSSELKFAWEKNFGYLVPDSGCCGTGLDVMVNVHLPALILLDEMSQVVSAFGAVGLCMDTEISDDLLVAGFGQMLRVTNNMTVVDSEYAVLSNIERAVNDLVVQEEQARERVIKDSSLRRVLYNKIACALAVLKNSLLMDRSDTFEYFSWLRLGVMLGVVEGITLGDLDSLHRDVWASNFLALFDGSYEEAVEHVNVNRAVILSERLREIEVTF